MWKVGKRTNSKAAGPEGPAPERTKCATVKLADDVIEVSDQPVHREKCPSRGKKAWMTHLKKPT